MASAAPQDKIASLEALRGLMAWWVVLGHLAHTVGWQNYLLLNNGLAVDVFIILSGYVIFRLLDIKREAYLPYITRRACRIFPLYLVVLAVSAMLLPVTLQALIDIPFVNERNSLRAMQAEEAIGALSYHLAAHIPLAQGVVPNAVLPSGAYTIVGQAWSVSLEWQFYLLAPVLFWLLKVRKYAALLAGFTVLVLLTPMIGGAFLGSKIALFGVGIGSFLYRKDKSQSHLVLLLFCAAFAVIDDGPAQIIPLIIWAAALRFEHADQPALSWLGERTYSVYLVHMLPLYGIVFVLNGTGLDAASYTAWLFAGVLASTFILSEITYRFVEKPGMNAGRVIAQTLAANARPGSFKFGKPKLD